MLKPVKFIGDDFVLPFRPVELDHEYVVKYTIEKEETIQVLEQQFSVRRLAQEVKQDDYHFIQIDKTSEILLNDKPIDTTIYKAVEKITEVLYPLRIVVDKWGKWVELNSYEKLKERWENKKEEIEESYEGEFFETFFQKIENGLADNDSLIELLSGDWFLRAYFNGIHTAYTKDFEFGKKIFFPALSETEDIAFEITQKVNPYLNEKNEILVTQEGTAEDVYINGIYKTQYFLNPNNYSIEKLIVECEFSRKKIIMEVTNLDESSIEEDSVISLLV